MAKGAKKKNRKLRRQIRKTIGALLMVSAITVAAIPVQDIDAAPTGTVEKIKVAVTSEHGEITGKETTGSLLNPEYPYESTVPYAQDIAADRKEEPRVYTSGDGMFQFAYTTISPTERGAVILNFSNVNGSDTITIPQRLEAYRKYSPNVTFEGYCLVSRNDELLMYKVHEQKRNADGELLYETVNYVPDLTTGSVIPVTDLTISVLRYDEKNNMYYYPYSQKTTEVDDDGKPIYKSVECGVKAMMEDAYRPCYFNQKSVWENLISTDADLYYIPKVGGVDQYGTYQKADGEEHWRINAEVVFIGAEKIEETDTGWIVKGYRKGPREGVFAEQNVVTNLVIEASLKGIADYSFYGCGTLRSVNFINGNIETIGNGAFAGCRQLESVTIPRNSNIRCIGKDAFYGCESLSNFVIPDGLEALGDCAFEGCKALTTVNLLGSGRPIALRRLGNHLFRGCTALSGIEFPDGYNEVLDIDMFEGCTSLQYVKLPLADTSTGKTIDFKVIHALDSTNYPNCTVAGKDDAEKTANAWKEFRDTHPESFYFEGPDISSIHTTANNNSVTFKYPNQELYEKVVYEHDAIADKDNPDGKTAKTIYQVDNTGTLVKFGILDYALNSPSHPDIITIPETIGAFGIKSIGEGSFSNNCYLSKVTIPASVTTIGANAFKGCHSLRTVIYTDATQITSIGADAFKTQVKNCTHVIHPGSVPPSSTDPADNATKPFLYFVGAMLKGDGSDTETFKFAMSGLDTSKISHSGSDDIWITCHSGWPTNLEVEYHSAPDPDNPAAKIGEAQLVGYPRYDKINAGINAWVKNLPYVTTADEINKYANMIERALKFNGGTEITPPLTEDEQAFLAATLDITIPENVDSISEGLFSGVDKNGNVLGTSNPPTETQKVADTAIRSITINGVDTIDSYTFKGCTSLRSAAIIGSRLVDDYAFENCTALAEATIGSNLEDTGRRPFKGCTNLSNINCFDPGNFTYNSGILYRNVNGGKEIVECLENRGKTGGTGLYTVGPDELQGVAAIKEEAFAGCKDVAQVDLSKTSIGTITEGSFKEMQLNSIVLPNSLSRVDADAFKDNDTRRFIVYWKNSNPITLTPDAFQPLDGKPTERGDREVIFQCTIPSNASNWAGDYAYITVSDEEVFEEFTVKFYNTPDYPASTNLELLSTQTIRAGEDAEAPSTEGLKCNNEKLMFTGWSVPFTNVRADLDVLAVYGSPQYTVIFLDGFNGEELKREVVNAGGSATLPEVPEHPGYVFVGWDKPHYDIQANTTIVAKFVDGSGDINRFKVSFYLNEKEDEEPWWETYASNGEVIRGPIPPTREGYTFVRWLWAPASSETGVKQDTSVYAQWTPGSGGNTPGGNNPGGSGSPGQPGASGSPGPSGSASPSASASASPSASPEVTKYTVSVSGGSGSGRYAAGEIVAINAYYMGEGQAFDRWTSSTAGVGFSNPNATSATFTMPAANVAITATYKTGSGAASTSTGGVAGSGGGTGGSGTTNNNGTTVEVTKPGISNTNYAGATVSGATDNFIVKVTEDQSATDAVVAALQARYGDISRIKYLPMDISLYDSTGRTRIADTTGITVNLTLPIPDDLVQYAGNNKVAAIANGALEDLNVRFTTVGGVPCVNFTATHFSPYVIYVDTANLTEATIDTTPKTGDPIHPKWFLALGMACVSLILFFKRDKVVVKSKTKAA